MYFLPISSFPRNPVDFEGDYKYGLLTSVKGSLICSSISFKFHHQNSVLLSIIRSIRQPECQTPIKKKKKEVCSMCGGTALFQFSHSVMSDSSQPHGLQHSRPPCPSPALGVYSNSCPLSQ